MDIAQAVDEARLLLDAGANSRVLWRHTVLQLLDDYEFARSRDECLRRN